MIRALGGHGGAPEEEEGRGGAVTQEAGAEVFVHGPEPALDGGAAGEGRAVLVEWAEALVGGEEKTLPETKGSSTEGNRRLMLRSMDDEARRLLEQALHLSAEQRTHLAAELWASVESNWSGP